MGETAQRRASLLLPLILLSGTAQADEPFTLRDTWSGNVAHFMTGQTLGEDASELESGGRSSARTAAAVSRSKSPRARRKPPTA